LIGGSDGSLSIPDMRIWRHGGTKSWWYPMQSSEVYHATSDPLINQIVHFVQVVRGETPPLVSACEGLRTMQVVEAIQTAATTQQTIHITPPVQARFKAAE